MTVFPKRPGISTEPLVRCQARRWHLGDDRGCLGDRGQSHYVADLQWMAGNWWVLSLVRKVRCLQNSELQCSA